MKKLYTCLVFCALSFLSFAQICNPTGNLIIFSNYDGGTLNINLNAPMANIKIGVCTYEGVNINISGIGASSVTAVAYAGYNGAGTTCGPVINTNITGTPGSSVNTITITPAVTLSNSFGNPNMVCAYSCDNGTYQGGCNTVDQVEAYFLNYFPGSTLFSHRTQYGCWSGTQNVASGGNCCPGTTGVTNIEIESFILSPNPANAELHIAALNGFQNASFRVLSIDGKLVMDQTKLSETIDISGLDAGTYLLELHDGEYLSHKRFVKN